MTALPLVEIYAAKWRLVIGAMVGLWLVPLGLFLLGGCSGAWDVQTLGVALTLLGVAMLAHYLRCLRRKQPSLVMCDEYLWHDGWSLGRLPLQCVRNVWLSVRPEEGLSLNLDVDNTTVPPRAAHTPAGPAGAERPLAIHLGGLYMPMGPEALREDIAFRAVAARLRMAVAASAAKRA